MKVEHYTGKSKTSNPLKISFFSSFIERNFVKTNTLFKMISKEQLFCLRKVTDDLVRKILLFCPGISIFKYWN